MKILGYTGKSKHINDVEMLKTNILLLGVMWK